MLRNSSWSLRFRFLLFVGAVLTLPALIGILQGLASARRDVAASRAEIVAMADIAASPTQTVLSSTRDLAHALASQSDIRDVGPGCNADLAAALKAVSFADNISRVDAAGNVVCSARAQSIGMNAHYLPIWSSMSARHDFVVSGLTESRVTHHAVIVGLLPIVDAAGHFQGTLNLTVNTDRLNAVLRTNRLRAGSVIAVFDRDSKMIAASNARVAHQVFGRATHLATDRPIVQSTTGEKNKAWMSAIVPLPDLGVYVGLASPDKRPFGIANINAVVDIVLPIAMIILAWIAIWILTDRQLTRWIVDLRKLLDAYRAGDYAVRPTLDGAPTELRSLGDGMSQMAVAIGERDRSLRDALLQKSLLIKEIHHRVKNNLQVVMSILSLQSKRLSDPVAQAALDEMRSRINALALVHRVLYEIDDEQTVDVAHLLQLLAEQTNEAFGDDRRDVRITVNVAPRELPSEMAVPLSLLTVEILTNAFKHAFPGGRAGTIVIALDELPDGRLRLRIIDDGVGFNVGAMHASIGARLIRAFGQQLGGGAIFRSGPDGGTAVEILFRNGALAGATELS